jgi:hypothetical protein
MQKNSHKLGEIIKTRMIQNLRFSSHTKTHKT